MRQLFRYPFEGVGAGTVRRRCAHPKRALWVGAFSVSVAFGTPTAMALDTLEAGKEIEAVDASESAAPLLVLDTRPGEALAAEAQDPQLRSLMNALAQGGVWLPPERCAALALGGEDPMDGARDALFDQDAEGVRAGALGGLLALICEGALADPSAVALPWFYLGVGALLGDDDPGVERYFSAIHSLSPPGFTPPELGQQTRERFDAAAASATPPGGEILDLGGSLPPGVLAYLDGVPLPEGGAPLSPVPHTLQLLSPSLSNARPYGQLLLPIEGGWSLGPGGEVLAVEDIGPEMLNLWEGDVIRALRVADVESEDPGTSALGAILAREGVALELLWEGGDGELRTRTLKPRAPEVAQPTELLPPAVSILEERHRVGVSLGLGASVVRGALFTPTLLGDVAIQTPLPFDVELGLAWGLDLGLQGESLRGILNGRSGLKFGLREDIGLFATLGFMALTRGPDPADPTIFIIEGMGGAWLRLRPPSLRAATGVYLEMGGGFSPGVWRADGANTEGPGTTVWFLIGFERR